MLTQPQAPVFQKNEIFIAAPPQQVWATLTHVNEWPLWNTAISKATLEQPAAPGVSFRWTVNGVGIHSTLHTVQEGAAFGWTGKTFGATAVHNWYLEPRNGGTLVRVEESMDGWLVRLFKGKMNRDLQKDMAAWLQALKVRCEQSR